PAYFTPHSSDPVPQDSYQAPSRIASRTYTTLKQTFTLKDRSSIKMKSAPLVLATLAIAATSEAARVHGNCKIQINSFGSKAMTCKAVLPSGITVTRSDTVSGSYPKLCAKDDSICWQMNVKSPPNIDVFYANTVRQTTGVVTDMDNTGGNILTWRTSYDVNF
ncbi:hypothetical protein BG015_003029, partial [Linnemannia schmuckeri]